MPRGQFDAEAFYAALDSQRLSKGLAWIKVAEQAGVSASTLIRMAQGKRPDVNSMTALLHWSGLQADHFIQRTAESPKESEPLAMITACHGADRNLTREAAKALESVMKATYERWKKQEEESQDGRPF